MVDDITFATVSRDSSRVHVIDPEGDVPPRWNPEEWTVVESIMRQVIGRTYCGRVAEGWRGGQLRHEFDDDLLCHACWTAFPGDRSMLFRHPIEVEGRVS